MHTDDLYDDCPPAADVEEQYLAWLQSESLPVPGEDDGEPCGGWNDSDLPF